MFIIAQQFVPSLIYATPSGAFDNILDPKKIGVQQLRTYFLSVSFVKL